MPTAGFNVFLARLGEELSAFLTYIRLMISRIVRVSVRHASPL